MSKRIEKYQVKKLNACKEYVQGHKHLLLMPPLSPTYLAWTKWNMNIEFTPSKIKTNTWPELYYYEINTQEIYAQIP